jgi:hypothetical protein
MEILHSLEVRWFFGDAHPRVIEAPAQFGAEMPEKGRVDQYLFTERVDIGFKARNTPNQPTKVETKYRTESLGVLRLAPNANGNVERWTKLSLASNDPEVTREGKWLALEKNRRLRTFSFERRAVAEVAARSQVKCGCLVELTGLRIDRGETSVTEWTLGLEAFGPASSLLPALQATCDVIFAESWCDELRAEWSMGYPAWLAQLPADVWTNARR